jgi:hypothetical protein
VVRGPLSPFLRYTVVWEELELDFQPTESTEFKVFEIRPLKTFSVSQRERK